MDSGKKGKKKTLDDGEVEISDQVFDEFSKNPRTCTHTHTCNPPGPDAAHTHTCFHTHTQVFGSEEEDELKNKHQSGSKSKKSSGNREAVRKYREKKKAQTAYLEEEVKRLHSLNQQLSRRLQGQALLEAEVLRLRSLLFDLRGKIDNELSVFPFQKQCNSTPNFKEGDCSVQSSNGGMGLQCETDIPCFHSRVQPSLANGSEKVLIGWEGSCEPTIVDCRGHTNGVAGRNMGSSEAEPGCLMPENLEVGTFVPSASHAE